jgi:hypothetical protein
VTAAGSAAITVQHQKRVNGYQWAHVCMQAAQLTALLKSLAGSLHGNVGCYGRFVYRDAKSRSCIMAMCGSTLQACQLLSCKLQTAILQACALLQRKIAHCCPAKLCNNVLQGYTLPLCKHNPAALQACTPLTCQARR